MTYPEPRPLAIKIDAVIDNFSTPELARGLDLEPGFYFHLDVPELNMADVDLQGPFETRELATASATEAVNGLVRLINRKVQDAMSLLGLALDDVGVSTGAAAGTFVDMVNTLEPTSEEPING